jgi:hypothetical protein
MPRMAFVKMTFWFPEEMVAEIDALAKADAVGRLFGGSLGLRRADVARLAVARGLQAMRGDVQALHGSAQNPPDDVNGMHVGAQNAPMEGTKRKTKRNGARAKAKKAGTQ